VCGFILLVSASVISVKFWISIASFEASERERERDVKKQRRNRVCEETEAKQSMRVWFLQSERASCIYRRLCRQGKGFHTFG
jgi:hypothetical protein